MTSAALVSDNPIEAYLVRRILIVDSDLSEVAILAGILANVRDVTEGTIDDVAVYTLRRARAYIEARKPSIVIIDPAIGTLKSVLRFIADIRAGYPNIVWVINRRDAWWNAHAQALDRHAFGSRLKTYYHRSKTSDEAKARTSLLATLALCQNDFVLELLRAAAGGIQTTQSMTGEQLAKFVSKVVKPVLSLLATRPIVRRASNVALVLVASSKEQKRRYEKIMAPILRDAGYKPIMIAEQFASSSIPIAALASVSEASLFVGDVTGLRPDVMIEVSATYVTQLPLIFLCRRSKSAGKQLPVLMQNLHVEFYTSDDDLGRRLATAVGSLPGL